VNEVLSAFKNAGSEARYIALDIRDHQAVSASLDEVRRAWGPIAGIVHGAGVLADKLIAELTPERFEAVFSTKVEGLEALLDATRKDPLRFIALFSSVAARNGNPGQAAYAMANEVMNRVAHAEAAKRGKTRVKSLNWGPWDGGMVTPALRSHFEKNGVSMLGIEEGANLFAEEILRGSDAEIEIVLGAPLSAE
jgi:NAD(P)-dependent dehydrogenase (short-subunit alcohol dehydrogenase family)